MRVVVLRLSRITTIDATGASVLADTISRLERRDITVLLSGVRPSTSRCSSELGVYDELAHERHLFDTTPEAIAHARLHAGRVDHAPADGTRVTDLRRPGATASTNPSRSPRRAARRAPRDRTTHPG